MRRIAIVGAVALAAVAAWASLVVQRRTRVNLPSETAVPSEPNAKPVPIEKGVRESASAAPPKAESMSAQWHQAIATWGGVLVAFTALAVSAFAWHGQQEINRQQLRLNETAQRREDQVYASRVAIWATIGTNQSSVLPAGLDVSVQNRAPVPLYNVRIVGTVFLQDVNEGDRAALIGDVPPCTVLTLRLATPAGTRFQPTDLQWAGYSGLRLVFAETGRRWLLVGGSLHGPADPRIAAAQDLPQTLRKAAIDTTPVSDCAEAA